MRVRDATTAAKLRVLAALPTPPPYSGPEMAAALHLASGLGPDVELIHGSCTFLFMGHLSVAKGFADLLRAVPVVLDAEHALAVS